jgi:hypothetical protein
VESLTESWMRESDNQVKFILVAMLGMGVSTASAHDWFGDLKSPTGERCCTDRDCRPADHRYNPQSHRLEIGVEGFWLPVDPATVVPTPSADGNAYACYAYHWLNKQKLPPLVRCVILPGEV